MPNYLAPLILIALMAALSVFFLHILSRQPTVRTVVLLPVGGGVAAELMLRESVAALSRLSCEVELAVVLHGAEADPQTLQCLSLMQQDYPFLTFVSADGLDAFLCGELSPAIHPSGG